MDLCRLGLGMGVASGEKVRTDGGVDSRLGSLSLGEMDCSEDVSAAVTSGARLF